MYPACWASKAAWTGEPADEVDSTCLLPERHKCDHDWTPDDRIADVIIRRGAPRRSVRLHRPQPHVAPAYRPLPPTPLTPARWARVLTRAACVGLAAGCCYAAGALGHDGRVTTVSQVAVAVAALIAFALAAEDVLHERQAHRGRR